MKRIRFLTVFAVALMILPAAAFAGGQEEKGASSGKITETFAGTEAATTTQSKMMQAVAGFDAKVLVAGAPTGDTDALVTQAKLGSIGVPSDPGGLSQFAIDMNILMAPYILTDPAVLKTLPDTSFSNNGPSSSRPRASSSSPTCTTASATSTPPGRWYT